MAETDPNDPLNDPDALRRMMRPKFPLVPLLAVLGFLVLLVVVIEIYEHVPQKGVTLEGEGYLVVTPTGETWALFNTGAVAQVAPESAAQHKVRPGPCKKLTGSMQDPLPVFELDELDCQPGEKLLPSLVARLKWMGLRFGYWADGLKAEGDDLNHYLEQTPEVVAALIDPRADDPQVIPMYMPLAPLSLQAARKRGLPPPVLVSVKRNDLLVNRYRKGALMEFLDRSSFIFAGASPAGGWLVRELLVAPDGTPSLERLLVAPEEAPWPERMKEHTIRVARRGQPSERSAEATQKSAGSP
jgi:hypothetical protein